jgi:hypothetical protein
MARSFDFLTLHLHLDDAQPPEFDPMAFFAAPEIPTWEWTFSRSLIHETLHFWQFLGSRYLLRLADADWRRIEHFEEKRAILPPDPSVVGLHEVDAEVGFSAYNLLEGWARLWEIQIQPSAELLRQEGIDITSLDRNVVTLLNESEYKYPWHGVELAMMRGANNAVYGTPFRWMVEQVTAACRFKRIGPDIFTPNRTAPSYLCCVAFPTIVYGAFQRLDPVAAFKSAVRALCVEAIHLATALEFSAMYVELDWFQYYETFLDLVPGDEAPDEGPERFYRALIPPDDALAAMVRFSIEWMYEADLYEPSVDEACDVLERFHRPVVFAFMGFRPFRVALSLAAPPPIVYFRDEGIVLSGHRTSAEQTKQMREAIHQAARSAERVRRFRAAEKAAELNLPLDAFDQEF